MSLVYGVTKKLSSLIATPNAPTTARWNVTLLVIRTSIHFLAFIPVYDYEKRVMNDKYVRVYRYFV